MMTPTEQPIAPHEPMPHRKVIREWLVPLSEQTTVKALALLVVDLCIWAALLLGTVALNDWWAKLLGACSSLATTPATKASPRTGA